MWENQDRAQALGKERASLESVITTLDRIDQSLTEASELAKLAEEEEDEGTFRDIEDEVVKTEKEVERLEFRRAETSHCCAFAAPQGSSHRAPGSKRAGQPAP